MPHPTEEQLLRLVAISDEVADLEARVKHQFGAEHVAMAKLLAVRANGAAWVFGSQTTIQFPHQRLAKFLSHSIPQLVVLVFATLTALAVLFPPFQFAPQGGASFHMGFHSIFDMPANGNMGYGNINVPLLAVECLAIAVIGAAAFYVANHLFGRTGRDL